LKRGKGLECAKVWHTELSGAPGPYKIEPATLGKTKAGSAIIHRTVRCATELFGEPAGNSYPAPTVDSEKCYSCEQCHVEVRAVKSEGHRTVRCRKKTKLQQSIELRTLTVGWHSGALDTEQCVSGGAPDYSMRP
jgi:hypothetical protein